MNKKKTNQVILIVLIIFIGIFLTKIDFFSVSPTNDSVDYNKVEGDLKMKRVCYFTENNQCNAEVRIIDTPCNFIRIEDCERYLYEPEKMDLFDKIDGVRYFDKSGNEVILPYLITGISFEDLKLYFKVGNDLDKTINCGLKYLSVNADYPKETRILNQGEYTIFETELIKYNQLDNTNLVHGIIECFYLEYGQKKYLPEKSEYISLIKYYN